MITRIIFWRKQTKVALSRGDKSRSVMVPNEYYSIIVKEVGQFQPICKFS